MITTATGFVNGADNFGMVASTGCNTVYTSTYPYNPYKIPWANSLFENGATFAMGIRSRWDQMGWENKKLWVVGGDGAFTSLLEFKWDAIFDRLFVGISHSGQTDRFAYSSVDSQHLDGTVGGDANSNFNWVSMVLEADGTIKVYMRGVPITLFQSGTFADTTIVSADLVSTLFDNDQIFDSSDITSATQLDSKVYEVMMFNESLSHQQLHGIDMYIKNKYKNYQFGRVNGY